MCYTVSLRETSKFKNKDEIKTKQFSRYLFETPYKVSSKSDNCRIDGGFCIESSNIDDCREKIDVDESYLLVKKNNECKKNGKNSCCYTDYECWNNGGECTTINPDTDTYRQYDKWSCPSKMDCYVKKEDYYSYGEYIQRFGGDGIITLLTDIKPGETYAISFGSPTETCNWCTKLGIHLGAAATMGILLAVSNPVGWTILIGAGIAGGITYATVRTVSKLGADAYRDYIQQREFPTIYLTTLSQIQEEDLCTMVKEV